MVDIGDRIQIASRKVGQEARTGVVTRVSGRVVTVRWSSGEESSLVPGPGTLTVVGRGSATTVARKKAAPAKKKARPKKSAKKSRRKP